MDNLFALTNKFVKPSAFCRTKHSLANIPNCYLRW